MRKGVTKYTTMLLVIFLAGCGATFEEVEKPKEIEIVVEPVVEEEVEEEEKMPEVENEELAEPFEDEIEEVIEMETEEIGGGWVEPLEEEMPDDYFENFDEVYEEEYDYSENYTQEVEQIVSYGECLTAWGGVYWYGDQKETYYNLDMSNIVSSIKNQEWLWNAIADEYKGNVSGDYWIREDGCKMLGDYIMVAANLDVHPRGSLVMTSLGMGVVVDTGGFAANNPYQVDIATNW